jgi:predicted transcriptional regulator
MPDYPRKPPVPGPGAIVPQPRQSQSNEFPTPAGQEFGLLTVQDVNNILEVNQKALTIYLEVEKQNEDIIDHLERESEKLDKLDLVLSELRDIKVKQNEIIKTLSDQADAIEEIHSKTGDLDKNFFRLIIILGSAGIGTVITVIQAILHH